MGNSENWTISTGNCPSFKILPYNSITTSSFSASKGGNIQISTVKGVVVMKFISSTFGTCFGCTLTAYAELSLLNW